MTDRPPEPTTVRRRRKEARPAEIVEAALACFLENGFEATRIDAVAKRAGVAKGTVFLYFATKDELFRAVVAEIASANVAGIVASLERLDGGIDEIVPALLACLAETFGTSRAPAIARLILREADRFPDLARIWLDDAAMPLLSAIEGALVRAQRRGEVRQGEARFQAISLLAPVMMGMLLGNLMARLDLPGIDLNRLAHQHADTLLNGLVQPRTRPSI